MKYSFSNILTLAPLILFIFLMVGSPLSIASDKNTPQADKKKISIATFAGGCFWCTESDFEKLAGVIEATSGYTGGYEKNPTYKQVSAGTTHHLEAVRITYDPSKVTYKELLGYFWRHVDPTDSGGQFIDRGSQYLSAIFYHNEKQKTEAKASKASLEKSGKFTSRIVTEIRPAKQFYPAEDYHQDYYKKNPLRYKYYRYGSGRDQFLEKQWGDTEK